MESGLNLDSINAPQYFDFSQPAEDVDGLENYFDFDHENQAPVASIMSDSGNSTMYLDATDAGTPDGGTIKRTKNTPRSMVLRSAHNQTNTTDSASKSSAETTEKKSCEATEKKSTKVANLFSSLSAWKKRTKPVNDTEVRRSPRVQVAQNSEDNSNKRSHASPALRHARRSAAPTTTETQPRQLSKSPQKRPSHSRTRSVDNKVPIMGAPAPPKLQRSSSVRLLNNRKANTSTERGKKSTTPLNDSKEKSITPGGSKPEIPSLLKKDPKGISPVSGKLKSTEQLEIDRIREFQKVLAQKRKANENYRQKTMAVKSALKPLPSSRAPTRPEEFHFKSDLRIKSHDRKSCDHDERDFKDRLRSSSPDLHKEQHLLPKRTVPQPFSFDKKRKRPSDQLVSAEEGDKQTKFVPMAEQIKKFSATPERFRSRPVNKEPSPAKRRRRSMSQPNVHLTVAQTPKLQTRNRSRPVTVKSHAEIEEEEMQELHRNQFRAKPVNERIFENSCLGVKKIEPKRATVIEQFDLETNRRGHSLKNRSQEEEHYEFHAQPIPRGIFDGPTGIKPSKTLPVTMPESPAFALKHRLRSSIKVPEVLPEEKSKLVKAKPAPHHGLPYLPKFEKKYTEPEPFSFEERNRRTHQQTQEKLKRIQEEEIQVTEFHAKPVPDHSALLPPKLTKPTTTPMPFQLEVDARGAMKAEEWSSKIKEELKEQRNKAVFKAQPNKATCDMFIPRPSTKPLTVLDDVTLNTDVRASDREQWQQWKHEKLVDEEELRQQRDEAQRRQEQEDIERMRKEMVTQAQPIRKYKPVTVKHSERPLTKPLTPKFSERLGKRTVRL